MLRPRYLISGTIRVTNGSVNAVNHYTETKMTRIDKICLQCAKVFSVKPSRIGQQFCDKACKTAHEKMNGRPAAQVALIDFTCRECGRPFSYKPSDVRAYEAKFGKRPQYCSIPCSAIGRQKDATERARFICEHCGKEHNKRRKPGGRIYAQQRYCSHECKVAAQMKRASDKFERGEYKKHIKRHGYVYISVPSLSRGTQRGVLERRHVMAQHLGRDLLAGETVHRINGNRQDNRIENLELFSSRHGPGQRVIDKIDFAIEMLRLYPEFARAKGVMLVPVPHEISAATPP